ncbi:DNA-binding protein c1d [Clydaea vesicula]|uniref:Exosome complex protein n=1 Tax=Clydaea vesicula TaxID=447962 RepID=A0AAD5XRS6_9FUNG|nr:DNA-binding protein c1d [Clydaea vesicula]KAJ3380473.1 DNA-binding protein c1d [Lobulomyces angularis]
MDLNSIETPLFEVEKLIEEVIKIPYENRSESDKLTLIKLNVMLSFTINSLFFGYLKTQGANPSKHAVKSELNRIREKFQKISKISEIMAKRPKNRINEGVVERILEHELNSNVEVKDNIKLKKKRKAEELEKDVVEELENDEDSRLAQIKKSTERKGKR